MQCSDKKTILEVAARSSPLSKVQVTEIYHALQHHHPDIHFQILYMSTIGDRDQKTSLRSLERSDFFTRDIDQWVLKKPGRIGIHSAKDLPFPLTQGLVRFCLTKGIDPSDSLVLRPNETLEGLAKGAKIATSSVRREETVKELRTDLTFFDLRGTIDERLAKLKTGEADGVVVAEAALIRLGLTHLNRIRLPGITTEGQGQLAVVGREDDPEIKAYFTCLDANSAL